MSSRRERMPEMVLWAIVVITIGVGAFSLASFGWVLILFGVLMAFLAPLRKEPRTFWPLAAGLGVMVVAYLLVAPARCSAGARSEVDGGQVEVHFCESLAGIDYERVGTEDPTPLPAFAGSLAAGLAVAGLLRLVVRRREERPGAVEPEAEPVSEAE